MISIVVPTLNEAQNLETLTEKINAISPNYRIIFIDDNSKDGTAEILKRLSKKYNVNFFIRKNKRGYGSALKLGLEKAKNSEIIVTMDADLSHNPSDIPKLIKKMQKNDIVIGSRYIAKGKIRGWPLLRRITSKLTNLLVSFSLNLGVKDNTSSYRAYSGTFVRKIIKSIRSEGYSILEELLFLARKENAKISEIPITFQNRKEGKSKANMFKEAFGLVKMIMRLRKKLVKRFIKFLLVGFSGIVVNEGLLWLLTEKLNFHYLLSGAISIEASIISNFILNDLWTFRDKRNDPYLLRMLKFNVSRVFTGVINLVLLFVLTTLGLHYLVSNLIGIAVATIIGFTLSFRWVWK